MRVHVGSTLEFTTQRETSPGGFLQTGGGWWMCSRDIKTVSSAQFPSNLQLPKGWRSPPPPILDHIPQTFTRLSELVMLLRWIKVPPERGSRRARGGISPSLTTTPEQEVV